MAEIDLSKKYHLEVHVRVGTQMVWKPMSPTGRLTPYEWDYPTAVKWRDTYAASSNNPDRYRIVEVPK